MPITEKQRESRINYLGSSDMPAVLGMSRFSNAHDVYLEKTGQLEAAPTSEAAEIGNKFESGVLAWAEEKHLGPLTRLNLFRKCKDAPLGSHSDAFVIENTEPVDAKTAGLLGPLYEDWGESGTDEVPEGITIQGHVHMICTGKKVCHIPAILGGRGFQMYHVGYDADLASMIKERAQDFWNDNVLAKVPPEDITPSLKVIKRIRHTEGEEVTIEDEIMSEWFDSKEVLRIAKKTKEESDAKVLGALGAAEYGNSSFGQVRYLMEQRKGYTVEPYEFRQIRFRKAK